MAQVDYFLKIDGIEGESTDSKHKNEIEIESFSWGVSQAASDRSHSGGGSSGKASFQDFHFTKHSDKASPKLMLACASGQHLKSAVLSLHKAGEEAQKYMEIKLSDVLVSSYQSGGSSGSLVPTDQFSLNFAKIEVDYKTQDAKGKLGGGVAAGWDVTQNKKA